MDKEHKMNCNKCGQEFDMRDLSQVFAHEPCDEEWVDYAKLEKINKMKTRFKILRELILSEGKISENEFVERHNNNEFDIYLEAMKKWFEQFKKE